MSHPKNVCWPHTEGRELLGLSALIAQANPKELGSQYVDLTQQEGPEQLQASSTASQKPDDDFWLWRGDTLVRVHCQERTTTFWPSASDPIVRGFQFDDMRLTKRSDANEHFVHHPLSKPAEQNMHLEGSAWTGESHFGVRRKRDARPRTESKKSRRNTRRNTRGRKHDHCSKPSQ